VFVRVGASWLTNFLDLHPLTLAPYISPRASCLLRCAGLPVPAGLLCELHVVRTRRQRRRQRCRPLFRHLVRPGWDDQPPPPDPASLACPSFCPPAWPARPPCPPACLPACPPSGFLPMPPTGFVFISPPCLDLLDDPYADYLPHPSTHTLNNLTNRYALVPVLPSFLPACSLMLTPCVDLAPPTPIPLPPPPGTCTTTGRCLPALRPPSGFSRWVALESWSDSRRSATTS
jgi:hypothetical protein